MMHCVKSFTFLAFSIVQCEVIFSGFGDIIPALNFGAEAVSAEGSTGGHPVLSSQYSLKKSAGIIWVGNTLTIAACKSQVLGFGPP
jgi:hypothetical protein